MASLVQDKQVCCLIVPMYSAPPPLVEVVPPLDLRLRGLSWGRGCAYLSLCLRRDIRW